VSSNDVTLCLIVKNEERYIDDCLQSCSRFCKDTVIVDTGSSDRTIEIVEKYTKKIKHYRFDNDFSAARNMALEGLETEWILFLDADERFEQRQIESLVQLLPLVDQRIWGLNLLRYNFFQTGGWYSGRVMKVFRNRPEIRYHGHIGESVSPAIAEAGGAVGSAPIILNHFGHCRPARERDE
jgi:glycosyltransferase involved in cell wall biosynthesis